MRHILTNGWHEGPGIGHRVPGGSGPRSEGPTLHNGPVKRMRGLSRALWALPMAVLFLSPSPVKAWGFEAHKFIAERTIALLPPGLRELFERQRTSFVEHAIDPDLWRNVGFVDEPP